MNAPLSALDISELSRAVQAVEPPARLLPARLVRRVVRRAFDLSSNQNLPHCFCVDAATADVESIIDRSWLGDGPQPDRVLLLPLPEEGADIGRYKVELWKRLFHARIDRAAERSGLAFADWPDLFTPTQIEEIRQVMEADRRLPPGDAGVLFREFVTAFLELRYFDPGRLGSWFPGILHANAVAEWLEARIDAEATFRQTRFDPSLEPARPSHHGMGHEQASASATPSIPPDAPAVAAAEAAAAKGNDVRAATILRHAGDLAAAREALRRLTRRFIRAISRPEGEADRWYGRLEPVLNHAAAHGFWDVGDRLLYELQKACLDVERKVWSVDLVEWAVTFGQQPIKRLMDKPKEANVLRRLRAAIRFARRLPPDVDPHGLTHALEAAVKHVEGRVRTANRPVIHGVLDKVGLKPTNPAEEVARKKLVEELLDVVCARGFLKMGDLRDAIARNRLKLPDLRSPMEFVTGDPLIRANRLLAVRMDGIYRRGEVYMRALQRCSSLAFGTPIGRLLVLFLILPFGGAYVILEGLQHLLHFAESGLAFVGHLVFGGESEAHGGHHGGGLANKYTVACVGLFLIGIIHSPAFRRVVGRYARRLFFDWPAAVIHSPAVRAVFNNFVTRFFARYVLTPLVVGAVIGLLMRLFGYGLDDSGLGFAGSAVLTALLFRTRWGRGLEERLDESLAHVWKVVSVNFLIGLLTAILQVFQYLFELIERGMYAVDEQLRFREGQGAFSFAFKLVFGLVWFAFAYVFRFAWNLLIEPQINPIKHFPVVTVSHKLILPTVFTSSPDVPSPFAKVIMSQFEISAREANGIATSIVMGIPGIFGFLVWELKENWKLYKANGSRTIRPAAVGSHGERIRGLLRPGFHSGVVPKSFAKLRRAEADGNRARAAKMHHQIEHVAEVVDHLIDRELLGYLRISKRWDGAPIPTAKIHLSTNRIRALLNLEGSPETTVLSVEERGGWLIGSVEQAGWLDSLSARQRSAFADALSALYKIAGVHLMREHLAALLGVQPYQIDCRPEGLVVYSLSGAPPVLMDADEVPSVKADRPLDGRPMPELPLEAVRLDLHPVEWGQWVERWEQDRAGKSPAESLLGGYRVLPEVDG